MLDNRSAYNNIRREAYCPPCVDRINQTHRQPLHFVKRDLGPNSNCIFIGFSGYWALGVDKDLRENRLDFTILVAAFASNGESFYRFNPSLIEHILANQFGSTAYTEWKQEVFSDLGSLRELVEAVRTKITRVIPSVTCSDRSVRLCKRVGIPVERGIAFLLPDTKGF